MGNFNTKEAQRARLYKALKESEGLTTSDCREHLGIMHPAGRIKELRNRGISIDTTFKRAADSTGVVHRQGWYVLVRGAR